MSNSSRPKWALAAVAALVSVPTTVLAQPPAVAAKTVNLRAGPGQDYPLVLRVGAGTPLAVQGCLDGYSWCDVIVPGNNRGWVYAGNIAYAYQDNRVPLLQYGAAIGLPIIGFTIGSYWGDYYRNRPFYRDRGRWESRPPPGRPGYGGPMPGRPAYGGPPPGRPGYAGPPPGPPGHFGPPPGRPLDSGPPPSAGRPGFGDRAGPGDGRFHPGDNHGGRPVGAGRPGDGGGRPPSGRDDRGGRPDRGGGPEGGQARPPGQGGDARGSEGGRPEVNRDSRQAH